MNKALLPAGFHDALYPEAGAEARIVEKLVQYFEGFGYGRVSPPAIEFEDSLFSGAGEALAHNTFRLMDPMSHKMMGVRADMTVQIARMAATRLVNEPLPLRLSYAGDVFRVQGDGLYAERQFTQAGVELIGSDSVYADAEVVALALKALETVGVGGLCIDFTMPGLVEILLEDMAIDADQMAALLAAIKRKDVTAIRKFGEDKADLLVGLVETDLTVAELQDLPLPAAGKAMVQRLVALVVALESKNCGADISVDPLESLKFPYHEGVGFSIFSRQSKNELGRGGRYRVAESEGGIGVTLYVNELFRALPASKPQEKILVGLAVSDAQVQALQADGLVVIGALAENVDLKAEAKRLGCGLVFAGKVVRI